MATINYKKIVTLSANRFEIPEGAELFIKFDSKISIIDRPAVLDKEGNVKEPAATMPAAFITNLETGEVGQLVLPQVLNDTMEKSGDYVGKCYRIVKHKVTGKRYFNFELDEIELEEEIEQEPVEENAKKKK